MKARVTFVRLLLVLVLSLLGTAGAIAGHSQDPLGRHVPILAYHDISDDANTRDADALSVWEFTAQMTWLKTNGYQAISLAQYQAYLNGKQELPRKAVILVFDDGYLSYATKVVPILRAFNYPSAVAVVGSWVSQPLVKSAQLRVPVENSKGIKVPLASAQQLKELVEGGLVEVVSHTYAMHHNVRSSPQGTHAPRATTRAYVAGGYQEESEYQKSLRNDFEANARFIEKLTGSRPSVMVWPYGSYNLASMEAARDTGHSLSLSLDARSDQTLGHTVVGRRYLSSGWPMSIFIESVVKSPETKTIRRHLSVAVPEEAFFAGEVNPLWFDQFVESFAGAKASHVFLAPYAGAGCVPLFPWVKKPDSLNKLTTITSSLQRKAGAKVLLDFDFRKCPLPLSERKEFVEEALRVSRADGAVFRLPSGSAQQAEALASLGRQVLARPLVLTTEAIPSQLAQLKEAATCGSDQAAGYTTDSTLHIELELKGCSERAYQLHPPAANFGLSLGEFRSADSLTKADVLYLHGLIDFQSSSYKK